MSRVKKTFKTVAILCAVFAGFATIIYRFEHPTLTETQIFIKLWKMYAIVMLVTLVSAILNRLKNEE